MIVCESFYTDDGSWTCATAGIFFRGVGDPPVREAVEWIRNLHRPVEQVQDLLGHGTSSKGVLQPFGRVRRTFILYHYFVMIVTC